MPRLSSLALLVTVLSSIAPIRAHAQTDLDAFMKDVVARRDDNWKKLQQYVLDEREEIALNGPGGLRLWGEQKDYTWFLREGFFIKSPVRANGAAVSEADRRKFEDQYMMRTVRREGRGRQNEPPPDATTPTNVDSLIRQTRQPQFVSSSYFLRFKFDEGRYALVGREPFEGRDVLRVEYYPTRLYEENRRGRRGGVHVEDGRDRESDEIRRLLNKVAVITLWVEPSTKQIVKYTFDNVDFEFLPAAWLVSVDSIKASMTMSQPFKDVWLPKDIEIGAAMTLAIGQFTFRQTTNYHDYREAKVTSKVIIK
jgi:hypothetical protein